MERFWVYFVTGFQHITDPGGFDHMLFLLALTAIYQVRDWKKVLVLVTAFTIGHSLTLAAAALDWIPVNPGLIEFLIPVTILLTAVFNLFHKDDWQDKKWVHRLNYGLALCFGLIHGMGFSNYLKAMLGKEGLVFSLFSFNVGLEAGQLVIVFVIFALNFLLLQVFKVKAREWNLVISGAASGIALVLMMENKFWVAP